MKAGNGFIVLCCCMIVLGGIWSGQQAHALIYYRCGDGLLHPRNCDGHGGYRCKEGDKVMAVLTDCLEYGGAVWEESFFCGDGAAELLEECDNGYANSDTLPDGCRTDCRRAHCGDSVTDTGEDCDNGPRNSDIVPNACRTDCRFPVCGDGVLDSQYGYRLRADGSRYTLEHTEECDDGNPDSADGCRDDCRRCVLLSGNYFANTDTSLCRGSYAVASYADSGAIIVQTGGVVVDCAGASLQGTGTGAGIYVRSADSVTIRNCNITGYEVGVKAVNSHNLIIERDNHLDGNTRGIVLVNSTRGNLMPAPGTAVPAGVAQQLLNPEPQPDGGTTTPAQQANPIARPVLPPVRSPDTASGPAIASPHSNQVFTAPASFQATVAGSSRGPVIFRVRSTDGGSFRAQSRDGRFAGIPAGGYCVEAALQKTPNAPGPCVPFQVTGAAAPAVMAPTLPARPATLPPVAPAVVTPPPALPALAVASPGMAVPPSAKVVAEGRQVFLDLNVAVARAEVYAATRLLGQLPGGSRLEITAHVPNAVRGELIMHYFDARGTKTVQKIQVGSVRK